MCFTFTNLQQQKTISHHTLTTLLIKSSAIVGGKFRPDYFDTVRVPRDSQLKLMTGKTGGDITASILPRMKRALTG